MLCAPSGARRKKFAATWTAKKGSTSKKGPENQAPFSVSLVGQAAVADMLDAVVGDDMAIQNPVREEAMRYYGKYRGIVVENIDPLQIGRIMALVPDVLGKTPTSWAMPCVPAAGVQAGCFIVPAVGSQIWMEFERGDPDYPIWTGGFWGIAAEVPVLAFAPLAVPPGQNIVLQTTGQNAVLLSDAEGDLMSGIVLRSASGAMIVVNNSGITIDNGQGASIVLEGPSIVFNPPLP